MMDKVQRDEENNTKFRRSPPHPAELEGLLPRNTYVEDTMNNCVYSPVRKEPAGLYAESLLPDSAIDRGTIYTNSEVFDSLEKLRVEIEALRSSVCSRVRDKEDRVYETIDTKHSRSRKKPENSPPTNRIAQRAKDTGFHRLRFFLDPNIGGFRRFVWILLFVCAVAATVYQIRDRVLIYTRYPSNVNIDVDYVDTISFPGVTICNENKYRLTDTVRRGFYNIASALGPGRRRNGTILSPVPHSANTTYSSFLRAVAHQKIDLINTCVWNNEPCGPNNFTEVFTDHGLCYKFVPQLNKRTINRAGPTSGLFLILNAEQYEYMTDSKSAVGVKFSIHDADSSPWMNEHGINAAVGTHTSVGLKKIVHENLPSPHGHCGDEESARRDRCLRQCDQDKILEVCKCQPPDINFNPPDYSRECSVSDHFMCVQAANGYVDGDDYSCDCKMNCRHNEYQPTLSHAATSVYAGESIVRQFAKKKQLTDRLRVARDMQQRVDRAMFRYDSGMLTNISKGLDKSFNKIDVFSTYMMESYKEEYDSRLSKLKITLERLNSTIRESLSNFVDSSHIGFFSWVSHFRDIFRTVSTEALAARSAKMKTTALNETAVKLLAKIRPLILPNEEFFLSPSGSMLDAIDKGIMKFRKDLVLPDGPGQKYEQFREHQDFYNVTTLKILNETRDLLRKLTYEYNRVKNVTSQTRRWSSSHVDRAVNDFLESLHSLGYLKVELWVIDLKNLKHQYIEDQKAITGLAKHLVIIGNTFPANITNIDNYLTAIKTTLSTLRDVTHKLKGELSSIALDYREGDVGKTYMASTFDSNTIRSSLDKLRSSFRHLTSRFENLMDAGISVRDVIYPVENGTKEVEFDLEWLDFPNLEKKAGIIKGYLEKIVSSVTDYQNDLKEYLKGNKLDENFYINNYLHLEVYFTELSETRISQHQSYSLIDLTCDIGGTLALYLGICILTIFETLDFFVNHIICPSNSRNL